MMVSPLPSITALIVTAALMGFLSWALFLVLCGAYIGAVAGLWCALIWSMAFLMGMASNTRYADDGGSLS